MIPDSGVIAPMSTSDVAGIWRVVFANRMAVEVIVVKPEVKRKSSVEHLYTGKMS